MKKLILLILCSFALQFSATALDNLNTAAVNDVCAKAEVNGLPEALKSLTVDDFLNMTPKKYKELTGEKLGLKKTLALKAAQKAVKKHTKGAGEPDIPKGLYIVLAILGWGWLAMGLMDDFEGKNWWVNLILVILCWLPGLIHALIKMKEYYK